MAGTERKKIEKLCRYIARPPVAIARLSLNQKDQVVYTLKKAYDDGTTHIVMTKLELLEKLAALVPRPRIHLTRFAGVFAPNYKYRSDIVPKAKLPKISAAAQIDKPRSNSRISWARLLKRVFNIDTETCQLCKSKVKIIAAIEDPYVIKKILNHLGLPLKPPTIWPARGPPSGFDDYQQFPEFDFP